MVYKITISRQPFTVEFEAGSIGEAVSVLTEDKNKLQELFGLSAEMNESDTLTGGGESIAAPAASQGSEAPARKPRKNAKDATTASAPAPIVPPPAAAAPAPTPTNTMPDIPDNLKRTPPPPPVMPAAPSIAPAAASPPTNTIGPAIIAELNRRATTDENKVALVNWLATTGLIAKGAHYDEALAVIPFTTDEKLRPIFTGLALT